MKQQLTEEETEEIWANRKYTLILPDDIEIEGETDENGNIEPSSSPIGKDIAYFIYEEEDDDD